MSRMYSTGFYVQSDSGKPYELITVNHPFPSYVRKTKNPASISLLVMDDLSIIEATEFMEALGEAIELAKTMNRDENIRDRHSEIEDVEMVGEEK